MDEPDDIMADGFFLESTIGEYARSYLLQLQGQLRATLERKDAAAVDRPWLTVQKSIVEQIGDDIIRVVVIFGAKTKFTIKAEQRWAAN